MYKTDYVHKALELLNDTTTYRLLAEAPTARMATKINKTLKKLLKMQRIIREERWKMWADASNIAKFYGLSNVHKEDISLRSIVSLPGALTNNLPKELWKYLELLTWESNHVVNNAQQLLDKIKDIKTGEDVMLSFCVTE